MVAALLAEPTRGGLREGRALLRLRETSPPDRLARACQRAQAAGDGRYRTVRGILERKIDALELDVAPGPQPTAAFLRGPAAFRLDPAEGREVPGC